MDTWDPTKPAFLVAMVGRLDGLAGMDDFVGEPPFADKKAADKYATKQAKKWGGLWYIFEVKAIKAIDNRTKEEVAAAQ